jgi:hypothetical protein
MLEVYYPLGKQKYVAVYDDVVPADVCDRLSAEFITNEQAFTPGRTISGIMSDVKCSVDLRTENAPLDWWHGSLSQLDYEIHTSLTGVLAHYVEKIDTLHKAIYLKDSGYQLQRYHQNLGYYRTHVDSVPWSLEDNDRILAVIVYLNDVEVGGETEFVDWEITVSAKKGRVLVFPATWTFRHAGLVPLSGDKFIISTFVTNDLNLKPDPINEDPNSHIEGYIPPVSYNTDGVMLIHNNRDISETGEPDEERHDHH